MKGFTLLQEPCVWKCFSYTLGHETMELVWRLWIIVSRSLNWIADSVLLRYYHYKIGYVLDKVGRMERKFSIVAY